MKVIVEFIDQKGFWSQRIAKSKKLLIVWIKALTPKTEVKWLKKNHVHISQQYC